MKRIICVALTLLMLMSAIPGAVLATDTFGWTATTGSANTAIDVVETTRGDAVAFRAWGATQASMSADKAQSGAYAVSFSMMVSDLNAVRELSLSGIKMLTIDKAGEVTSGTSTLKSVISENKWYDVELVVYTTAKTYTVTFDGVSATTSATSISELTSVVFDYTEIDTNGATTIITTPSVNAVSEPGTVTEDTVTVFGNNNTNGSDTSTSSTRTYNASYPDPTGAGRGNIFACIVESTGTGKWAGGEYQGSAGDNLKDRTKMSLISADVYVHDIESGEDTPMVTRHELIGYCNGYYYFFQLNHDTKILKYADNSQSKTLNYELGQWLTMNLYIDFPNNMCYLRIYGEDGSYIGGCNWTVDFDSHSKVSSTIGRFGMQVGFRDAIGPNYAYIDNYCWNNVVCSPEYTETVPYYGKTTVGVDDDTIFKVSGGNIDPESLGGATVKVNGSTVSATVSAAGPRGARVNLTDNLLPDTQYTVTLEGVKDINGYEIAFPGMVQFTTKGTNLYGNLDITEGTGGAIASIPVSAATQSATLYAVAFNADNSMAGQPVTQTAVADGKLKATVTDSYTGAAEAYLWDAGMNIITPAVSTDEETFVNATPCEVTVTKTYEPVGKFTIKGTANRGAAMKFYKVLNKGQATETKQLIYIKEVTAHANGYFETSFCSDVTGDIELLINTQNGEGIKTISQKIYSPSEAQSAIDAFNYLDNNPTYNGNVPEQYNAMVNYYDNLIREHCLLLGINITEYNTLSKNKIADVLLTGNGTYLIASDVLDMYNMAVATAKFDAAVTGDDIENLIGIYHTPYNFAASKTYAYYGTLSDTVKKKIYSNMADENDYKDMADVVKVFEEQAVLAAVECATVNSEINYIIAQNNDNYLGLDLTDFNALDDTTVVTSQIKGVKYSNIELFKSDFALKAQNAKNNSIGGSPVIIIPPAASAGTPGKKPVSLPVTEEVITELIKPAAEFDDIKLVPWAEESIRYLVQKGVVNGKSDTNFAPNDNVKRCEFVKMIALAFPEESKEEISIPFADVESGEWYEEYVKQAYQRGIINGKTDTIFGVNDNITREELVVMLYRMAKARGIDLTKTKSVVFYDDAELSDWSREAVYALAETEIVSGAAENTFLAKNPATRAEAAKLVYCLMQREAK